MRHFDNFILFIILLSCIMQMLQNPKDLESDNNRVSGGKKEKERERYIKKNKNGLRGMVNKIKYK